VHAPREILREKLAFGFAQNREFLRAIRSFTVLASLIGHQTRPV
jgi:hypothetical protein